ncbi:hypothetical protein THTE_0717 [Thermogutta terrifontis]|uniref:Uncharacterized protein n=1 Tax=Thermogutta terrifontis TaxID=1331910 RepID=A0A286RBK0_9BACT|nr:hypothetical protein THTE_0717 [Thermogutta terrifontis]
MDSVFLPQGVMGSQCVAAAQKFRLIRPDRLSDPRVSLQWPRQTDPL